MERSDVNDFTMPMSARRSLKSLSSSPSTTSALDWERWIEFL